MRASLCMFIAASLLTTSLAAFAGHPASDDGDGPPVSHGNSGNHGPPPGSGDGSGSGTTHPGNGGKPVSPPAGSCSSDGSGIDLTGPQGQSGASHVAHTDFGKIDPSTGDPVASSSSARMMYFWYGSTFDFVLNAHGLESGTHWTLTYQPEPLPSSGVMCLGDVTANGGGQLHLANSIDLKSNLPPTLDPTVDPSQQPPDALLALVPSGDVDCAGGTMTTFAPENYLWSNPRVRYVDTDLLPPSP